MNGTGDSRTLNGVTLEARDARPPRWPLFLIAAGAIALLLAVWPEPDRGHHDRRGSAAVIEAGRIEEGFVGEEEDAPFSAVPPRERPLEPGRAPLRPLEEQSAGDPIEPPYAIPSPDGDDALPWEPLLPIWAQPGVLDPEEGAPTSPTRTFDEGAPTRAVRRALRERDARIGLDLAGAGLVARSIASAVRTRTPPVSVATFEAHVSSDGEIVAIRVLTFSGGTYQDWADAANEAQSSLVGVVLPLPGNLRGGAVVGVRITQDTEHPSGAGRKENRKARKLEKNPTLPWIPKPGRLSRREEPIVTVKDNLPPDLQGLGDPETMVAPCNADGSGCIHLPGDLVDLGTSAARIVRAFIGVRPAVVRGAGPRASGPE